MTQKGLFLQNVIAVIWDFDKTLSPHYMQAPLFRAYSIDESSFWDEVNALPAHYRRAGIHVDPATSYLGHLLTYVQHGLMPGLTNGFLRELGAEIEFYPGLPEFFPALAKVLETPEFSDGDLHLEHYVVSTGLAEMIRGSRIAPYLSGVWASEFIETPAPPRGDFSQPPAPGPISQIASFLDNTTKTRAIFEINKGVNKNAGISVNDAIPEEERRVPFQNMIYIADGPSDIPSFSVMRRNQGLAYAVYAPQSSEQFAQAVALQEQNRVDSYGPADYTPSSQTFMWLRLQVERIAQRIMDARRQALQSKVLRGPVHIKDDLPEEA